MDEPVVLSGEGIAWNSDKNTKFGNPECKKHSFMYWPQIGRKVGKLELIGVNGHAQKREFEMW